jgi:hypothetical protein
MPSYSVYGSRDDQVAKDGDVGFLGFNNRVRPDQLPQGMLADARNIRLDRNNEAQVRRGIELISNPIAVGTSALTLPFTLPTAPQIGDGTTAIISDNAVNAIYGSCAFSDPNSASSQYIIFASNSKAVAINLSTLVETDIAYPALTNVSQSVDMIQAFNKVFIFRNGETALEWNGSFSGTPAFTKVESGTYSQPQMHTVTMPNITANDGLIAFTIAGDVTSDLPVDSKIRVYDTTDEHFDGTVDEEYLVTSSVYDGSTETVVKAYMPVVDHAGQGHAGNSVTIGKQVSVGGGFSHMPAPPFAVYHQRRLVMPYNFNVEATNDTFTSRGILDEVVASDILDSDTYDKIYAQYRFNAGTSDFIVGLLSFAEDSLLVFNRNSLHIVQNSRVLEAASTRLLTDEVGCVARRSIVQVGNQVIFLSDNGVYGTQFLDEYNLRGTETPLSEPINETVKRINKNAWSESVGVYFDNRYYLAVPIDESTSNNAILVYNFLNKQWESVDQVDDSAFHISNLIVAGEGDKRGVYITNDIGGLHKLDERVDGVDRIITQAGGTQSNPNIPASLTTRQYTFGTMDRKRWKEFDLHVQSSDSNASNFDISIETENPDANLTLSSLSEYNGGDLAVGEDVSIRARIGNQRGYGLQLTINNTTGRPRVRALEVQGGLTMRSTKGAI